MQKGIENYPAVVAVRLTRQQADQLRQRAQEDDRPASALIRRILTEALNKPGEGVHVT
jgi:hypothetical protein